ncbi:hypothetical protein VIGAN_01544000 [Vigna angularis var. angularis]|uniref:Uncharacterized protein n=1 Tax=Vigna angularis var. angularis TaxID=157739 RepID=A0A0S3R9I8_PHAAN|nr:hypothetical protein VIGAN_01544000 [Vigna angularis var. angularis]
MRCITSLVHGILQLHTHTCSYLGLQSVLPIIINPFDFIQRRNIYNQPLRTPSRNLCNHSKVNFIYRSYYIRPRLQITN